MPLHSRDKSAHLYYPVTAETGGCAHAAACLPAGYKKDIDMCVFGVYNSRVRGKSNRDSSRLVFRLVVSACGGFAFLVKRAGAAVLNREACFPFPVYQRTIRFMLS